jgi:hypothetical protein
MHLASRLFSEIPAPATASVLMPNLQLTGLPHTRHSTYSNSGSKREKSGLSGGQEGGSVHLLVFK